MHANLRILIRLEESVTFGMALAKGAKKREREREREGGEREGGREGERGKQWEIYTERRREWRARRRRKGTGRKAINL